MYKIIDLYAWTSTVEWSPATDVATTSFKTVLWSLYWNSSWEPVLRTNELNTLLSNLSKTL